MAGFFLPVMQSLDAFLPHIQPWLMAAPDPLVRTALVRAARDFCERTHVLQQTVGPLNAVLGQADYPFTLPADLELVRVKRAWWETTELNLVAPEDVGSPLAYVSAVGTQSRQNGRPSEALMSGPLTITVAPPPDASASAMLTMRVVVRPTLSAATLPDELLADWIEALVARTVLNVAGVPGVQYVDAAMVAMAQGTYTHQVGRACDRARRGPHQTSLRVQPRPFI